MKFLKILRAVKLKMMIGSAEEFFIKRMLTRLKMVSPLGINRFMPPTGKSDISVDRFDFCSYQDLVKIQEQNASNRNNGKEFHGWVKSQAKIIKKNNRKIEPNPIDNNPYHALIVLPGGLDKKEQKKHAVELAKNFLQWQPKDETSK